MQTPPPTAAKSRALARKIGLFAGLAVLATIAAPGITVDEPLDVRPGRTYVSTLRAKGWKFFDRDVVARVFADNKEHPPLGRWMLGIASTLVEPIEAMLAGPDPLGLYVVSGRVAPAIVFALLVGIVASEAGRRYGDQAAWASGLGLLMMPRLFSHAHLGALDLFIAAAWTVAYLKVEQALGSDRPIRGMAVAGLFWGLALLVKIHAWLLPPIVLVRTLIKIGPKRGAPALAAWTGVGLAVFFVGWPWLWYDTIARFAGYLGTGVDRVSIHVQYFGQVYRDKDVPWHFPWVTFATTVPVGLHLSGAIGLARAIRQRDGFGIAIGATIAAILAFFSTDVPVYDGERLFLLVFPLWAILIGRGFADVWARFASKRGAKPILIGCLAAQGLGLALIFPFGLSYYNLLVGGLPGAERLGLELCYWSESVDRRLLDRLAVDAEPGSSAALAPTLAPDQGKIATSRRLIGRRLILGDESEVDTADRLVVYRRTAYWKPAVERFLRDGEVVATRSRLGVWLSAVVRRAKRSTPPGHRPDNS